MTDRFHSLTVTLERDIREDDARSLIVAIQQMRGVLAVSGVVADSGLWAAELRAWSRIKTRVLDSLREPTSNDLPARFLGTGQ